MPLSQSIATVVLAAGLPSGLFAATDPRPDRVTFSSHIASIIHQRCAYCHHEGQGAPFNLLTHEDVRKRLTTIADVIEIGFMPPWLAEPGFGDFSNDCRLTGDEKSLLRQWIAAGAPEGDSARTPPAPQWPSRWLEGTPDLVVTMEKPYRLAAEGPDVYRHFVIRLPLKEDRFVRAVQFAPGNPRIVHHAFIRVDEEGHARALDGAESDPGFSDAVPTARMPGGQFLTWNPGSRPIVAPRGLAWRLRRNSDLVVEMHLNRTGKAETLQSSVGFYFTDEQPTNACYTFKLGSFALDFPAGIANAIVRDSFVLPVDVVVLAAYPHAHFLAREMQGYAILPNGTKEWLIWIKQWDFNWQGDYRYTKPLQLPKGTTLHLQYTYDNSTNNPANPNHPPKRVVYGEQSKDEMCELGLQVLTRQTNDLNSLQVAFARHRSMQQQTALLQRIHLNPNDAEALTRLGMSLLASGRRPEAREYLQRAVNARPDFAEAHHNLGVFLRFNKQPAEARREFEIALQLDSRFPRAHQQLGLTFADLGQAVEAVRSFQKALDLNPADSVSKEALAQVRQFLKSNQ